MRIQVPADVPRAWRAPGTLPFGEGGARAAIIEGLTDDDAHWLDSLIAGADPAGADPAGAEHGTTDPDRRRHLLRLLDEAGLVTVRGEQPEALAPAVRERLDPDARVLDGLASTHPDRAGWRVIARRQSRHVTVRGAGRTGAALAVILAAAGVGDVRVTDRRRVSPADIGAVGPTVADVGRSRERAVREAVRRVQPRSGGEESVGPDDLVVLVNHTVADSAAADSLLRADVAHLSVVLRDTDAVVGPLVRPGFGPCLRCLDLHRADRDPAWPRVQAQLVDSAVGAGSREETTLATLTAALAAAQSLAYLDGHSPIAAMAATLEIGLPDGLAVRRAWPAHARCGCHWPPPAGTMAR